MVDSQNTAVGSPELVNVVIPVYNVAQYVEKCVDSVLAQTYANIRVWLVDDGSTDRCPDICDEYVRRDSRVVVLHKANGGQASARNMALDRISAFEPEDQGRWVAFVDSDDWVEPDYIDFLVNLANATGAKAVQCGHWISYSDAHQVEKGGSKEVTVLENKEAMESVLRNGLWDITCWNKLFELSVFDDLRFPEGIYYEDTAIAPLFTERLPYVSVRMVPKYHYVQRYTSTANGVAWTDRKLDFIPVGDKVAEYTLGIYPDLVSAANEKRAFVRLSTLAQMVNTNHRDIPLAKEIRKQVMSLAPGLLGDGRASIRDKAGVLTLLFGVRVFTLIWRMYYGLRRKRS